MKKNFILFIFFLCFIVVVVQKKSIMGIIMDIVGEVVIGVSIVEVGIMNGMVFDVDGNFIFFVFENVSIQVLFIGFFF